MRIAAAVAAAMIPGRGQNRLNFNPKRFFRGGGLGGLHVSGRYEYRLWFNERWDGQRPGVFNVLTAKTANR